MLFNQSLYSFFMGGVAMALPFIVRTSLINYEIVNGKNHFFVFVAFLSVILFGFTKRVATSVVLLVGAVVCHAYLNQMDYLQGSVIYQFICFCAGAMLLVQAISNFKPDDNRTIFNALAISALLQSGWVFGEEFFELFFADYYNFFGGSYVTVNSHLATVSHVTAPSVGVLSNSNYSGSLLAICSIALLRKRWIWTASIPIIALYILGATLPIVSLFFGIIIYSLVKADIKKSIIIDSMAIVTASLVILSIVNSDNGALGSSVRISAWTDTVNNLFIGKEVVAHASTEKDAKKTSVTVGGQYLAGHGLGYFATMSRFFIKEQKSTKGKVWRQVHNEYLEFIYTFGLIGFVYIFIAFRSIPFVDSLDPVLAAMLGVIVFNSAGHFLFHVAPTAFIAIMLIGLLYNQKAKYE